MISPPPPHLSYCPVLSRSYDNICSNRGKCSDGREGDGTCTCNWGYTGPACDRICPGGLSKPCNGRGLCTSLEGCSCNEGWAGTDCTVECQGGVDNPCNGHGTCLSGAGGETPGSCACGYGWSGLACDIPCPGGSATPCLGHGECGMASGEVVCTCDASFDTGFWSGTECGVCLPPFHGPDCDLVCNNGVVVGKLCNCTFGYYGFGCTQLCPAFTGQGVGCAAIAVLASASLHACVADVRVPVCRRVCA